METLADFSFLLFYPHQGPSIGVTNDGLKGWISRLPLLLLDMLEHKEGLLNPKALRKKMPEPGLEVERMTTGTRYALKLWLLEQYKTAEEHRQLREQESVKIREKIEPSEVNHISIQLRGNSSSGHTSHLYTPLTPVNEVESDI
ncbi:hypothetical protein SK128_010690 [Halocaridina rubra]|uniref:Uncharacterized protein n=1 Tax=Halocaridina rubra TaxID=373956 RepID=A0AAN8X131_HALRR